ncbi:MBL fold metallo-hydrolase [Actinoallomurus iriomotensis]|uniref:Metallo-beta-lactamase domain-containing protein n=1 Tax=Actinoallomurus iriomotensis TaxID=478107 RepID=A0A9W6RFA8_9ACTN|nr:MBL fold metallo-hydrolase [Actinoallomurus iriomotensis]GLY72987.1 hypothetical protein Airi01_012540 [Actinoallomurus iriomotensis]
MTSEDLRLTVLGSASPYPSVDNPCSGYLVSGGDTRVWVDAGTGTLAQLQRHVRLDELDAIWISHLHADHTADLLTAYYGALFADVRLEAPIPLYGPPGVADRLAHFLTNTSARSPIESAFAVDELHDGHRVRVGALTLTRGRGRTADRHACRTLPHPTAGGRPCGGPVHRPDRLRRARHDLPGRLGRDGLTIFEAGGVSAQVGVARRPASRMSAASRQSVPAVMAAPRPTIMPL